MIYFIINEHSKTGEGTGIWKEVEAELKKRGIEYKAYVTEYPEHAFLLAEEISSLSGREIPLVVLGGDGTMNEVINGIKNFDKVRFGLIPTGSGNDMARGLGITGTPKENLNRILKAIEVGSEADYRMDLGEVRWKGGKRPRLFAISAGVGLDAIVCKKALTSKLKKALNKIHLGKLTYILLTVQTLFSMKTEDVAAVIDGKGVRNMKKVIFSATMNLRAEGGGVPMAPRAVSDDGKLSICWAHGIPKWRTFFCLIPLVMAKHEGIKGFEVINCKECKLHIKEPVVLHADGEYCGDVTDVEFRCLPGKLKVMM